jgi:hypothetical protein
MSDSIIQAMQRMDAIRARIQEIQQLAGGQAAQSGSVQSGSDLESGKADSARFSMLLQELAGSLTTESSTTDTSAQELLSGLGDASGVSGLTGGVEGLEPLSSLGNIDPALIARALEQYRSHK